MFPPSFPVADLQLMLEPGTMHANGAGPKDPLTEVFLPIRYTTARTRIVLVSVFEPKSAQVNGIVPVSDGKRISL